MYYVKCMEILESIVNLIGISLHSMILFYMFAAIVDEARSIESPTQDLITASTLRLYLRLSLDLHQRQRQRRSNEEVCSL